MSDLKTYLAANYMSGPKADAILARSGDPTMKKKRKKLKKEDYIGGSSGRGEGTNGLVFHTEDDEWQRRRRDEVEADGEDAPLLGKELATWRETKSQWSTVSGTSLPLPSAPPSGPSTQADMKVEPDAAPPVQLTKRKGGLRTAAQLREEAERLAAEKSPSPPPDEGALDPTVTVHRDASGRIMDVEKLKEEERLREEEEKRKAKERDEWSKGLVQRQQREQRARDERQMGEQGVARYSSDAAMNKEMREVERWNDPAAEFLTKKKKKGPRKPRYQGAYPPNRFGILPGFRWDGVDRSNGFEKKYFQHQNAAARRQYETNQWSMEDM